MNAGNDSDMRFLTRAQARRELHIGSATLATMIAGGLKTIVVGTAIYTTRRWIQEYQDEHAQVATPATTSMSERSGTEQRRSMSDKLFAIDVTAI